MGAPTCFTNKEYRTFDADPSQVIINGKVVCKQGAATQCMEQK